MVLADLTGSVRNPAALIAVINSRCTDLAGYGAADADINTLMFLLRAGFDETEIRSWCEDGSTVDVASIVADSWAVFNSLVTATTGNVRYPPALVASQYESLRDSGIDESLYGVHLAFRAVLFAVTVSSHPECHAPASIVVIEDWVGFAAVAYDRPVETLAELHVAGVPLSAMAEMVSAGMDSELMISAIGS